MTVHANYLSLQWSVPRSGIQDDQLAANNDSDASEAGPDYKYGSTTDYHWGMEFQNEQPGYQVDQGPLGFGDGVYRNGTDNEVLTLRKCGLLKHFLGFIR